MSDSGFYRSHLIIIYDSVTRELYGITTELVTVTEYVMLIQKYGKNVTWYWLE